MPKDFFGSNVDGHVIPIPERGTSQFFLTKFQLVQAAAILIDILECIR